MLFILPYHGLWRGWSGGGDGQLWFTWMLDWRFFMKYIKQASFYRTTSWQFLNKKALSVNFFRVPWDLMPSGARDQLEWQGKGWTSYLVQVSPETWKLFYSMKWHVESIYMYILLNVIDLLFCMSTYLRQYSSNWFNILL